MCERVWKKSRARRRRGAACGEGLGVDRANRFRGLAPRRQVAEQERVAVAELVGVLAAVVHADRNLDPHPPQRLVASFQPATYRSATTVSTTSLTVTPLPAACSIRFRSASSQAVKAARGRRRCVDRAPYRRRAAKARAAGSRGARPARCPHRASGVARRRPGAGGQGTACGPEPAGCAGGEQRNRPGVGSGCHAAGAGGSPSSSVSQSSSESIRRQVTPSARQWWMRTMSPVRPSASGPATSMHQSGRE